jgi:threonine/homoserine/homoserine lactone efflux protein
MFLESLWIGLAIAAPVGPIGLLVIQRTLRRGFATGLATGTGAAVADAVYGAVGAFGVTALIQALQSARVALALGGGAFMLWLAWRIWQSPPSPVAAPVADRGAGHAAAFAGSFALTLSNPATIFSFIAIFGAMGARADADGFASPGTMIAGVLTGSALWWLLLSAGVNALRYRFDARAMRVVNRVSALALAGFALWQWAGLR